MSLKKNNMYSIGQLAKMSGASIKQLRYLEAKGLLIPLYRDTDNNYRYYSYEQFNQLTYIKTLRDLGFSFESVVDILNINDEKYLTEVFVDQISLAQAEVRDAQLKYDRLVSYFSQLLKARLNVREMVHEKKSQADESFHCEIIKIPLKNVLFMRERAAATSKELFIDRYFRLQELCLDNGIIPNENMYAVFHDGYLKQFDEVSEDLETFFPIPPGRISMNNMRQFGDFKAISNIFVGHYKEMKSVYLKMEKWAKTQSINLMNISVEKYILGPEMTNDPNQYITQIIIPLANSKI